MGCLALACTLITSLSEIISVFKQPTSSVVFDGHDIMILLFCLVSTLQALYSEGNVNPLTGDLFTTTNTKVTSTYVTGISYNNSNIPSYRATNDSSWVYQDGDEGHWNFTDPDVNPCSPLDPWQGLNCTTTATDNDSYSYYYISEIHLPLMNLVGTIPESIGTTMQ